MSTGSSSSTITKFSRGMGMLSGGIALALVGGYLAFGSLDSDAQMGSGASFAAAENGAAEEQVLTRRGLRTVMMVADASVETEQSAMAAPMETRITRRGLRTVALSTDSFLEIDQSSAQLAALAGDRHSITRRGQR